MPSMMDTKAEIEVNGFAISESTLPIQTVNHLLTALGLISEAGSIRKRGGIFAVRNLLDVSPDVRDLAGSAAIRALVEPILGPHFFPVEAFFSTRFRTRTGRFPGTRM